MTERSRDPAGGLHSARQPFQHGYGLRQVDGMSVTDTPLAQAVPGTMS